ncbi:MAG TPA: tetratricopeptide repeat protein, partial [Ktedonobacteraceae bacterium]|nr:tetratricopeptide repeat protein [Ktedonobacteraceae bacterium]
MSTSGKHTFHAPNITFFTGRETFLHTLRETLLHKQAATIVGARGVGKTAAAQEYVRRFAQQYRRVFWINAATAETFLCDTLALAWRISLPVDGKLGFANALQMVQSWSTNEQDSLLVLDNVTFPQGATISSAQQLPAGHVVLITHDQDIPPELPCLKLDALDEMDGALLVLRRGGLLAPGATLGQAGHELRTSALELARMLQGSPVALNLAGGYIRESRCSVQDYVLAYRDYPTPSDQPDSAGDEQVRSIEVACGLTLTLLAHRPAAILALARLCSLLYSDYIPVALFEQQAAQSRLVASAHRQQPISLMRAIQHLQICGLLTVDQDRPFLSMHPLIQAALRKTFSHKECQQRITQLLHASQQFMLTREGGAQFIRLCVTGHIRRLAAQSEEGALAGDEVADALNQAASLLWEQGLIRDAEALVQKALAIWERTPGPTRPEIATAWLNLTVMNSVLKRYDRAE